MRFTVSIALLTLFITSILFGQDFKRYQFKSGYIKSKVNNGYEEIWFDNYGANEKKISNYSMEIMGMTQKTHQMTIMDGKMLYSLDLETNSGTKMENPLTSMFPEGTDLEQVGKEMMVNMGGKKIGSEKLLGKDCEIWEIAQMMSKVWIWDSIPLKSEVNMMGINMTTVAEKVEVDINIPPGTFDLPSGIEWKDLGNVKNLMGN